MIFESKSLETPSQALINDLSRFFKDRRVFIAQKIGWLVESNVTAVMWGDTHNGSTWYEQTFSDLAKEKHQAFFD